MQGKRSIAAVLLALCLAMPASAFGAEEEFEGAYGGFKFQASNGYRLFGFAYSGRADGRGDVIISVHRKGRAALYATEATVTEDRLAVDLGALGRIEMQVVPTGRRERLHSRCDDSRLTVEEANYVGSFEFHGEEGYTEASKSRIPVDYQFFADGICGGVGEGRSGGGGLPGARLRASFPGRADRLALEVMKNRPSAPTRLVAEIVESRGKVAIRRGVDVIVGAGVFSYDSPLLSATVEPPAPFAGSASFHRKARSGTRWTGDLTVDFPGRSGVSLTGAARTSLVHGQWSRHVTGFDRMRLGW